MSLLDILMPTTEQIEAGARMTGRVRTRLVREVRGQRKHELLLLRKRRYRARHPGTDKDIEKLRAWTAANREKFKAAQKRWARENKDRINAASARYRVRKRIKA
jgi:hypothetical protein